MADIGSLPEDGTAQAGPVPPPAGQRVRAASVDLVAWVTSEPMADAGRMWRALSDIWPVTGLVPVTLTPPRPARRPHERGLTGEDFGFWSPADIRLAGRKPVQALLSPGWELDDGDDDRDFLAWYLARFRAPSGLEFPGLAPAVTGQLPVAVLRDAVASQSPAHLGLVAAARPADVPPVVGRSVFGHDERGPGARSLEIQLPATDPPPRSPRRSPRPARRRRPPQ